MNNSIARVIVILFFIVNLIWFSYLITNMLTVVYKDLEPYLMENVIIEEHR